MGSGTRTPGEQRSTSTGSGRAARADALSRGDREHDDRAGPGLPSHDEAAAPAGGIFLSPRVVDREAFNDFAGSLRGLIQQAGEQAGALRAAAAQAQGAQEALRELAGSNHPRLEAALKALGALEQRSLEAQRIMASARDAAQSLESVRAQLAREVEACHEQARSRAGDVIDGLAKRLAEFEQQGEGVLHALRSRLEQQVDEAAGVLEARAQALHDRLDRRAAELEAWSKDLLRRTEQQVASEREAAGAAVQALMRQTADAHAEAQSMAADLGVLAKRGEALLSERGEGSLRALVSEGQRVAASLRAWVENPPTVPKPPEDATTREPKIDEAVLRPMLDTLREELAEDLAPLVAALRDVVAKAGR